MRFHSHFNHLYIWLSQYCHVLLMVKVQFTPPPCIFTQMMLGSNMVGLFIKKIPHKIWTEMIEDALKLSPFENQNLVQAKF